MRGLDDGVTSDSEMKSVRLLIGNGPGSKVKSLDLPRSQP